MPRTATQPTARNTIQCFKPGRHTDMRGTTLVFAESDLAATVNAYDPALWRAPLVVGHPTTDGPAYGHVASLAFAGGAIEAVPEDVNAEFAAQVAARAYTSVSMCFWRPQAPGNPVPGVYYPRHIGFLGAVPPAILGMRPPAFSADQLARYSAAADDLVEFAAWDDVDNASLWRYLRDWLLGKFGQVDADTALPPYLVASLERAAQADLAASSASSTEDTTANTTLAPAFAAPHKPETPAVNEAEKLALQAENDRLKQLIKDAAANTQRQALDAARADGLAFADSLVASDRLPTDRREVVGELFATVAAQEQAQGAVVQYGSADARTPLLPAIKQLLGDLPVRVAGTRLATTGRAAASDGGHDLVGFAAPAGAVADPDRLALHQRAQAWQAQHPGTSYVAACRAVGA